LAGGVVHLPPDWLVLLFIYPPDWLMFLFIYPPVWLVVLFIYHLIGWLAC